MLNVGTPFTRPFDIHESFEYCLTLLFSFIFSLQTLKSFSINSGYFSIMEGKKLNSKNIREKNRKPRKAIIISNLRSKLEEYIKGKADYEYMFPSRKGGHIQVKRVSQILKDAGDYFNLKS